MGAIVSYRLHYCVFETHGVIGLIPDIETMKNGAGGMLCH